MVLATTPLCEPGYSFRLILDGFSGGNMGIWLAWSNFSLFLFLSFFLSFLLLFFFCDSVYGICFIQSMALRWSAVEPRRGVRGSRLETGQASVSGRKLQHTGGGGGGVLADCLLGSAGWARFGLMGGSVIYNFRGEFSEPFSVHKWWPWRPWRQPSFLFLVFVWIVFPRSNMEAYKQRQQVQHKNSHFILNIWIAERGKNSTFIYIMRFVKYSKVALK